MFMEFHITRLCCNSCLQWWKYARRTMLNANTNVQRYCIWSGGYFFLMLNSVCYWTIYYSNCFVCRVRISFNTWPEHLSKLRFFGKNQCQDVSTSHSVETSSPSVMSNPGRCVCYIAVFLFRISCSMHKSRIIL